MSVYVTPLPEMPSRANKATFAPLGDAFLGALPQLRIDLMALAAQCELNAMTNLTLSGIIQPTQDNSVLRYDYDHSNGQGSLVYIDDSGRLLVGINTPYDTVSYAVGQFWGSLSTYKNTINGTTHVSFFNPNGRIGYIGGSATSVTYNTSSDYRLKKDALPISGALDRVLQLRPVSFKWVIDDHADEGFIAHELQAIVPQAVAGEKDEIDENGNPLYQGVDYSKLTPLLAAAIKEQQGIIESLKTRIEVLEGSE
jgi:hypothetical protein